MRLVRPALRTVSGGRLLRRNYAPGTDPGLNDSLVPQQGPNYALAKRLQRWRATVARRDGRTVSLNVAPPTRTRSVVKNRALASAYAGAHRFGIEVFEPATSNTLMAALLVHDLRTGAARADHALARGGGTARSTAGCGARPTTRAAPSGSPSSWVWAPPAPDPRPRRSSAAQPTWPRGGRRWRAGLALRAGSGLDREHGARGVEQDLLGGAAEEELADRGALPEPDDDEVRASCSAATRRISSAGASSSVGWTTSWSMPAPRELGVDGVDVLRPSRSSAWRSRRSGRC